MQIESRDYSVEISNLEKLITNIQANVFFTIATLVAIIALGIALGGWALKVLAKHWVEQRVKTEISIIDERVKLLIKDNPNILWASGSITPMNNGEIIVTGLKDFDSSYILSVEVWNGDGLHLEKIVDHNSKNYLSIRCPQLKESKRQVYWSVTWVQRNRLD